MATDEGPNRAREVLTQWIEAERVLATLPVGTWEDLRQRALIRRLRLEYQLLKSPKERQPSADGR
jgi:hypothetical protein